MDYGQILKQALRYIASKTVPLVILQNTYAEYFGHVKHYNRHNTHKQHKCLGK